MYKQLIKSKYDRQMRQGLNEKAGSARKLNNSGSEQYVGMYRKKVAYGAKID